MFPKIYALARGCRYDVSRLASTVEGQVKREIGLMLLLFGTAVVSVQADEPKKQCTGGEPLELYRDGCMAEARAAFEEQLRRAETAATDSKGRRALFEALISIAWFEDETGNHQNAIAFSNRALEIASSLDDSCMIARSLAWLGWSYSSMGAYHAAKDLYENAVQLAAPGGEIRIVPVWGLSTQELGALKVKMGQVEEGRKLIEKTYGYAKEQGIDIGVAEGGVHLVELELREGNLGRARLLAEETIAAAERCKCGPLKVAQAWLVAAKVLMARAESDATIQDELGRALVRVVEFARGHGDPRTEAEALMLQSKVLPAHEFQRRSELLSAAVMLLEERNSELRGTAHATLGHLLLDNSNLDLASYYLKLGVKVNQEQFRKIDDAYVSAALAVLDGLTGERRGYLQKLESAVEAAAKNHALKELVDHAERLASEYDSMGYRTLSLKYGKIALEALNEMLRKEDDPGHRELLERKLIVSEGVLKQSFEITQSTDMPN